jgi:acyl-CoA reductase-like NAD-dependent aldehyde dehydrogenase
MRDCGARPQYSDSIYDLAGGVHAADPDRALAVAQRIRTGTVSVNFGQFYHPQTPFGGYKRRVASAAIGELRASRSSSRRRHLACLFELTVDEKAT